MTKEAWDLAVQQLERIDRYLSKNWMDDEYPTDEIWECISLVCPNEVENE